MSCSAAAARELLNADELTTGNWIFICGVGIPRGKAVLFT
jgi:hypothetical protein